jgi:hypothetical protein
LAEATYYTLTGELYSRLLEKLCEEPLNNFEKLFFNDNELKEKIIAKKENNLLSEVFKEASDSFLEMKKDLWSSFKNELKEIWKITIDIDISSGDERLNAGLTRLMYPLQLMTKSCTSFFQKIMDGAHSFLSKYRYHLSILSASKLLDIFARVVDDEIIIAEKLGKGKITNTRSSYALYYDNDLFNLSNISASTVSFFDSLHFIHNYFQRKEKDRCEDLFSELPNYFSDEKRNAKFENTINYLVNRMENCSEEDRKRAKEAFELLCSCLTKLDVAHMENLASLFCKLIMEGLFAEIYSFRKLVEADLNVIPNLKIKSETTNKVYELDALIPITKDTVVRCESTLAETLDKEKIDNFKEVENIILKEMGLRCKTLVIGRDCLRSPVPSDADFKMLSFSELSNKPKVISTILSLI